MSTKTNSKNLVINIRRKRSLQSMPLIGPPLPKHIVVLTGAGISAESGLQTFRDSDGLWQNYSIWQVASINAWRKNRATVLEFYNYRRQQVRSVEPNAAHYALVELGRHYRHYYHPKC